MLALDRTLELGTRLDRDIFVDDIAFDPRGCGKAYLETAQAADHTAINHDIVGRNLTLDGCAFPDSQQVGADITLDGTLDLDITAGDYIALMVRSLDRSDGDGFGFA